jgi:hypothetical protein
MLVVQRVASRLGTPPAELPALARAIDPDSLEALFSHQRDESLRVTFHYAGARVTVSDSREVDVEPLDAPEMEKNDRDSDPEDNTESCRE